MNRLKDPVEMKSLYTDALAEYKNKLARQGNRNELAKETKDQLKEKTEEVPIV